MSRAKLRYTKWTPEEDALLGKLAKAGKGATEIAKEIDRNRASVRDHASRLNIALAKSRPLKLK